MNDHSLALNLNIRPVDYVKNRKEKKNQPEKENRIQIAESTKRFEKWNENLLLSSFRLYSSEERKKMVSHTTKRPNHIFIVSTLEPQRQTSDTQSQAKWKYAININDSFFRPFVSLVVVVAAMNVGSCEIR